MKRGYRGFFTIRNISIILILIIIMSNPILVFLLIMAFILFMLFYGNRDTGAGYIYPPSDS